MDQIKVNADKSDAECPISTADLKVTLITMHMNGHARYSGYDRLTDFIEGCTFSGPEHFTLVQKIIARMLRSFTRNSELCWYHRTNLIAELNAAIRWLHVKNEVFHFLYGENSFRYLGGMKRLNPENRIIATFHTPPEKFRKVVGTQQHLQQLDAIIVMSRMQLPFFEDILGKGKVFFVPHGVDVNYFCPIEKKKSNEDVLKCLLVGSHLRDFETASSAIRRINKQYRSIKFMVVTPEENHAYFTGIENVQLFGRISDDALLQMYQNADLFVLPLQESTANNVLLEAMSCGLPVIATDLQGVRDYVNDDCARLVKIGNADELAGAILDMNEDGERRNMMREASRKRALDFAWQKIAQELTCVYENVLLRQ